MHRVLTENEAYETLETAWNAGIRYFDTAPLYGHGLSELRIGRVLAGRDRASFLLSTKVGRLLDPCAPGEEDSGIYKSTPHVRVRFDYSYDGVMRSFEASLDRLGFDRIDILFVHDVDARTHGGRAQSETRIRELIDLGGWRALAELRSSGAVAAIGAGVNEWEPCARLLELADPDLFLLAGRYTLLEQAPLETLFPRCVARGVGAVVGGPFNSGILAGRSTYDYASAPSDILARVRALDAICRGHDIPLAQAALRFPLAHPSVVSVIAGAQTKNEVSNNAAMMGAATPVALWDDLKRNNLLATGAPVPRNSAKVTQSC
jgi:D-threo-aldose 1-dehydrogenase